MLSKLDRRNQAKQKRVGKHAEHVEATRVFAGRDGAPRVVAVVPLADDVSGRLAVGSLNGCLDLDVGAADVPEQGALRVEVERFKQRVQYLVVGRGLLQALDACRVADFVLFVLSAEQEVDALGELVLRSVESQGVSNVLAAVQVWLRFYHACWLWWPGLIRSFRVLIRLSLRSAVLRSSGPSSRSSRTSSPRRRRCTRWITGRNA